MKELLRKTFELIRDNPILWAPCLVAELLAICLWHLRGIAEKAIFRWFSTSHSVLGGGVPAPTDQAFAKATLAYIPLGLATIFVIICLFVVVLLVTAGMVNAIMREQEPDARKALAGLTHDWRRILLFSLKFLLAIGVVGVAVTVPLFYLLRAAHHPEYLTSPLWLPVILILYMGCLAWLMMPPAIRLQRPEMAGPISTQDSSWGMILAIVASETGNALGILSQKLEKGMILEFRWEWTALSMLNSILANAPDVLLFVALALLASESAAESQLQSESVAAQQPPEPISE
jgi:uncharacterized membrane protein